MTDRIIQTILLVVCLVLSGQLQAQETNAGFLEDAALADARELLQAGRKEIIARELRLSDAEAAGFWPVYEQYHADLMVIRDGYAETIGDYLRQYRGGTVDSDYAEDLIDKALDYKSDLLRVRKKYVKRFKKLLPIRKVVRFYQLENKMDADVEALLAIAIPLMDPV